MVNHVLFHPLAGWDLLFVAALGGWFSISTHNHYIFVLWPSDYA
jgi:hypothetical protein